MEEGIAGFLQMLIIAFMVAGWNRFSNWIPSRNATVLLSAVYLIFAALLQKQTALVYTLLYGGYLFWLCNDERFVKAPVDFVPRFMLFAVAIGGLTAASIMVDDVSIIGALLGWIIGELIIAIMRVFSKPVRMLINKWKEDKPSPIPQEQAPQLSQDHQGQELPKQNEQEKLKE